MLLPSPVTIVIGSDSVVLDHLDLVMIDDPAHRRAVARLHPSLKLITVWSGDDYTEAGDWTQANAEARILEILGPDIQGALQALVVAS